MLWDSWVCAARVTTAKRTAARTGAILRIFMNEPPYKDLS